LLKSTLNKPSHSSWAEGGITIGPNSHLDNLSDFLSKSLLEAGHGLPFLIGKDKKEILDKGLLTPKVGEVLKKFEGRSIKKSGK
jgi:hypothetical protein